MKRTTVFVGLALTLLIGALSQPVASGSHARRATGDGVDRLLLCQYELARRSCIRAR